MPQGLSWLIAKANIFVVRNPALVLGLVQSLLSQALGGEALDQKAALYVLARLARQCDGLTSAVAEGLIEFLDIGMRDAESQVMLMAVVDACWKQLGELDARWFDKFASYATQAPRPIRLAIFRKLRAKAQAAEPRRYRTAVPALQEVQDVEAQELLSLLQTERPLL